jgi:hypothetical protein
MPHSSRPRAEKVTALLHHLAARSSLPGFAAQVAERGTAANPSDMRVKVSSSGLYTYPDASARCATAAFEDDQHDTLLNPSLVIEEIGDVLLLPALSCNLQLRELCDKVDFAQS